MEFQTAFLPVVLSDRLKTSEAAIIDFCQRWHIQALALFGSVIRDDFNDDSDIDVLVVFKPTRSQDVFARTRMQNELAQLFGRDVDLTEKRLINNPFSKAEILRTHRIIYPPELANFTHIVEAEKAVTDSTRNNAALLDMVRAMKAIATFVQHKTFEDYLNDLLFRSAVERQLEILGEAANRLKPEFQAEHPAVDWSNVVGLRNVIIHQYDEIDYENIWKIATDRVPLLLVQIQPFVSQLPEAEKFESLE
ncbi:MAG: HepT-like ribonuclease domain-containing protein [Phormidesmis sp.]